MIVPVLTAALLSNLPLQDAAVRFSTANEGSVVGRGLSQAGQGGSIVDHVPPSTRVESAVIGSIVAGGGQFQADFFPEGVYLVVLTSTASGFPETFLVYLPDLPPGTPAPLLVALLSFSSSHL